MNYVGILIGLAAFLCIGVFHPLVIKGEYHFGKRCWWGFLAAGLLFFVASLLVRNIYVSIILGIVSFSSLWGIFEVFRQHERVKTGWFPMNPKRKDEYSKDMPSEND